MDNLLREINKVSLKFLSPLSIKETYTAIVQEAVKLTKTECGAVYLKNHEFFNLTYSSLKGVKIKHPKETFITKAHRGRKAFQIKTSMLADHHPVFEENTIKSLIYVPLSYREKSIGVLVLFSKNELKMDKQCLEILELFGSMASLAITRSQADDKTKTALKEKFYYKSIEICLESIYKAAVKFLTPLTPKETYPIIVSEAVKIINADYGSLALEENSCFNVVYSSFPIKVTIRKKGYTYEAYKDGKVFMLNTEAKEFKKAHPDHVKFAKSILFIPLSYRKKSVGVLSLYFKQKTSLKDYQKKLVGHYGALASLAVRKAVLYIESEKAVELRDKFIAIAAHEFRTPLTSINGYVQLLSDKFKGSVSKESRWIEQLNFESNRLRSLISEILEINRIKAGNLNYLFKECCLKDIVGKAKVYFSYKTNRKIVFNNLLNGNDKVIGDPEKLEHVVISLLDNAFKFSEENQVIILKLYDNTKFLIISIRDFGSGIAKSEIPKVIQGFYKQNSDSESGIGLGFYLANNIVKLHRGVIKISSKLNKGTLVEVMLPKIKI